MTRINEDERVGLKFSSTTLEWALQEIIREKYPFELVGGDIIVLPRSIAERFKKQPLFQCEEVKIVSLFHLPREEANRIRKRHLPHLRLEGLKETNKNDLINEVSERTGLTKKASREAVGAITSAITDCLARGEKVTLVGFGSFKVRKRKSRRGRNPQTGKEIQIPAKKVPKFKVGKSLREAVEQ